MWRRRPESGGPWRRRDANMAGPRRADTPHFGLLHLRQHGKAFATCDLKSDEGVAWLRAQLRGCDVLIQNMKWQDLERMGLMPDELQAQFPSLGACEVDWLRNGRHALGLRCGGAGRDRFHVHEWTWTGHQPKCPSR